MIFANTEIICIDGVIITFMFVLLVATNGTSFIAGYWFRDLKGDPRKKALLDDETEREAP